MLSVDRMPTKTTISRVHRVNTSSTLQSSLPTEADEHVSAAIKPTGSARGPTSHLRWVERLLIPLTFVPRTYRTG